MQWALLGRIGGVTDQGRLSQDVERFIASLQGNRDATGNQFGIPDWDALLAEIDKWILLGIYK